MCCSREELEKETLWNAPQRSELFIFPTAEGTAKLFGRYHGIREPTPSWEQAVSSEDLSGELQGEPEGPQPTESNIRYHNDPRVQLHVPKGETFPIPLKNIDVTRTTHTNLDVLQEKRIDDDWKVDVDRSLSDPWTGFKTFTIRKKNPDGYMWSGGG